MGIVSNYVLHAVQQLVDQHQVVVWFDAEQTYAALINQLTLKEGQVFQYAPAEGFLARDGSAAIESSRLSDRTGG